MKISADKTITLSIEELEKLLTQAFAKRFDDGSTIKVTPKLEQKYSGYRDDSYTVLSGIEISGVTTEEV